MKYNQFIINSLENMGSSFLFGTSTKLLFKSPDLYSIRESIKSGIYMTKYSLVNSLNIFILNKLGIDGIFLSISSVFLTSFYFGMRNGVEYARREGINSVISNLIKRILYY